MRIRRLFALMLLVLSLCSALLFPALAEETPYVNVRGAFDAVEGEKEKVIVSFLGDCTIGCNAVDQPKKKSIITLVNENGFDYPFRRVKYILEQDDLTVANFEGVLADSGKGIKKKTYNFRADPVFAKVLTEGSVEAVTLGNNHTADFGKPGFESTTAALESAGVNWFASTDYAVKTYLYEKGNARIGFVGMYISYYWQNLDDVKAAFDALREAGAQVVVAVIHGGVEYDARHDNNQTRFAKRMIAFGADAVVGHHPHRLQGYEVLEASPVFYSLGNFVFGGNFYLRSKYTVILQMAFSIDEEGRYMGYQVNLIPCRLSEHDKNNLYQPYPITGRPAELAIDEMQNDTLKFYPISDYQEGIGALQPYVKVEKAPAQEPAAQ